MSAEPSQYRVRNWTQFQHYRDRNPPWIKLHFALLASEDWVTLDDASKLLAVVCMLVASRNDGMVPNKPAYLKRVAYLDADPDLAPLILCGFLENPLASASIPQAIARPETETETETEQRRKQEPDADASPVDQSLRAQPRSAAKKAARQDGQGSDEDRFWALAPTLEAKGVTRSMIGKLANALEGDFCKGLDALNDSLNAKTARPYLSKIIRSIEHAKTVAPQHDATVPAWVIDARTYGYPVDREGAYWRFAGGLFDDTKQQVGN